MNEFMVSPFIMLFGVLYFMSFVMVINSDDWFLIWLGMEINMLSFIFLIYIRNSMNNIESCLKYFFVQSLGSALLMTFFYVEIYQLKGLGALVLGYKIGAGPFFFWFPSMCSGLNWWSCFFLMTFQKLIPLVLMILFVSWVVWLLIVFSLVFGMMGSFNQKELKRLMAFSSIHHVGWILLCMMINIDVWCLYLFMYGFMILPIIMMMSFLEINSIMNLTQLSSKWSMMMMMMSMGGMPPFIGFFMKWISFYYIMYMSFSVILFMILMSVIMLYIYIRLVYDLFLGMKVEVSWVSKKSLKIFNLNSDFISMMGLLMGCFFGFMMLL